MTGASVESEIYRAVGELSAGLVAVRERQEGLDRLMADQAREAAQDRRLVLGKLDALHERITSKVEGIEAQVDRQSADIAGLKLFRDKIGAVAALAGLAATTLAGGAWWLIASFKAELGAVVRRILP